MRFYPDELRRRALIDLDKGFKVRATEHCMFCKVEFGILFLAKK